MPGEIDPSALSRTDTQQNGPATPQPKPLNTATSAQKGKVTLSAPRVDVEPIYTSLKQSIGEHWNTYKDAVANFLLGELNLEELSRKIDFFITADPNREVLHNQLMCAVHVNVYRDAPDQSVASWVSANDKPASVSKPLSGDAAEARLKSEIMQLPPRSRHRLKGITDEPAQPLRDSILGPRHAKQPPTSQPSTSAPAPAAAAPSTAPTSTDSPSTTQPAAGLNKDSDIRRRFAQPLISETRDLPQSPSGLTDRLLSIAFESSLNSSTTSSAQVCAEYLTLAIESFLKDELTTILTRTRTDAPVSVPIPGADAGPGFDRSQAAAVAASSDLPDDAAPIPDAASASPAPASLPVAKPPAPPNGVPKMGLGGTSAAGSLFQGITAIGGVLTARQKKRLLAEDKAAAAGKIHRSDLGLLPAEREALRRDFAGTRGDLRLAWDMGATWLAAMLPWQAERVALRDQGEWSVVSGGGDAVLVGGGVLGGGARGPSPAVAQAADEMEGIVLANGAAAARPLGKQAPVVHAQPVAVRYADEADRMDVDEPEWSWQGADSADRDALAGLLDGCLAVGR